MSRSHSSHDDPCDSVASSRWCVSRQDLIGFRQLIEQAIDERQILPNDLDSFDPKDRKYGPNMYTICKQYIKPMTARAGNVSWALMLHPKGLECDLFISHTWAEGVFEFIDKVLTSWPRGARHAYCCILANPQNMDISGLLNKPSNSPFAMALNSATWVLVVPNRKCSIYSRIWCTYEAYLAYKWRKKILTASSHPSGFWLRAFPLVSLFIVVVIYAIARIHSKASSRLLFYGKLSLASIILLPISVSAKNSIWVHVLNYTFVLLFGLNRGIVFSRMLYGWDDFCAKHPSAWSALFYITWAFQLVAIVLFSELDCLFHAQEQLESKQLLNGYSGHVMDAKSSDKRDATQIKHEIRENKEELAVDRVVDVLIKAGMSTPHLQEAEAWGVDTTGAAHQNYSKLCLTLSFWLHQSLYIWHMNDIGSLVGTSAKIASLLGMAFVAILIYLPIDDRRFAANTASLFIIPCIVVYLIFCASDAGNGTLSHDFADGAFVWLLAFLVGPLTLCVSLMNPAVLCRVPVCGLRLTNLIVSGRFGASSSARAIIRDVRRRTVSQLELRNLAREGPT